MDSFAKKLLTWFDLHGRKQLPWQNPRSAYCVWISEIMLQQTQVATVINYFTKFITRFPDVATLAKASLDEVLVYWAGLGYYSRAKNVHRCAQIIHTQYHDQFPSETHLLETLPGIGPSTAGAIVAQAFDQFAVILDGNVKRVLSRYHAVAGDLNQRATLQALWQYATEHTPKKRVADYTQAIMDLGALICTRSKPRCMQCPLAISCSAYQTNQVLHFPQKKITRSVPKRTRIFVLLINEQKEILMEQQADRGIWSNLWSVPSAISLDAFIPKLTTKHLSHKKILAAIEHRFTHFHLTLTPILIQNIVAHHLLIENTTQQWVPLDQLNTLALPAPIKKMFKREGMYPSS
jgi:A/G-specific adenine glycosylase